MIRTAALAAALALLVDPAVSGGAWGRAAQAAGGLAAQEPAAAGADTVPEPPMAPTPRLFRLGASAGALAWQDESGRNQIDSGLLLGLELESRVGPWLAFRFGAAYGGTTLLEADGSGETDAGQYLIELAVVPRLGLPSLERVGVVPYATIGVAAVVHDPETEDLVTRSQNALGFGAGVDVDLGGAFGARAEWRRYRVNAEDAFDPQDREGDERTADRFWASLYWKL